MQAEAGERPTEQPRPLIVATIEAGEGGRVLVNGTEAAEWSSTSPFTLVLEAVPEGCVRFERWEVNGTAALGQNPLTLTIAGNTTVRAVFAEVPRGARFRVVVTSNSSKALAAAFVNGSLVVLPHEVVAPACAVLNVTSYPYGGLKPLNGTVLVLVTGDTEVKLHYRLVHPQVYEAVAVINGTLQPVEVRTDPFGSYYYTLRAGEDGWLHFKGAALLYIYIPWSYTRVLVEARVVEGSLGVIRFCDWGAQPYDSYGVFLDERRPRVEFIGCEVAPQYGEPSIKAGGTRYAHMVPGALELYANGEAWVRIQAYP